MTNLKELVRKLYSCEVKVRIEREIPCNYVKNSAVKSEGDDQPYDLIDDLYHTQNPEAAFAEVFAESDRAVVLPFLEELASAAPRNIYGKEFVAGTIDPCKLISAKDFDHYMKELLRNALDYKKRGEALLALLQPQLAPQAATERKAIRGILKTLDSPESLAEAFQALKTLTEDFAGAGEEISYVRLMFVIPYAQALLDRHQDRRQVIIGQLLRREYPYTDERREEWNDTIRSDSG